MEDAVLQYASQCETVQGHEWRGLREQQLFNVVFKQPLPAPLSRAIVPPAQRRPPLTDEEEKKMRSTLSKLMDARRTPDAARNDIWKCVDLLCSKASFWRTAFR